MRKNSEKDWNDWHEGAINETRPEGAGNTDEPLDIGHYTGVSAMPVEANITACGDSTSEHTPNNWKSIGDIARALAAQAVRK